MKKVLSLLMILTLMLTVMPQTAVLAADVTIDEAIGNLLSNGTFEDGISGWTATDTTISSVEVSDGLLGSAKAMKIAGAGKVAATFDFYQQETYEISFLTKDDAYVDVSYKFASNNETPVSTSSVDAGGGWKKVTGVFKFAKGESYKAAKLNVGSGSIIINTTGECVIDEVKLCAAEEKVVNVEGTDENYYGGWYLRTVDPYTGEFTFAENEMHATNTHTLNCAIIQHFALQKGRTYKLYAEVKADRSKIRQYWYSGNYTTYTLSDLAEDGYYVIEAQYTSAVPDTESNDTYAGHAIAFGGTGSTNVAKIWVKNISLKEVNTDGTEIVKAAPAAQITAPSSVDVNEEITPTAAADISVLGYRYRYLTGGTVVASGFETSLPNYTPTDEGSVTFEVTPISAKGVYGETVTKTVTVQRAAIVNSGISDIDTAIGNKLTGGTFEDGFNSSDWIVNGMTVTEETENTADGSFGAIKAVLSDGSSQGTIIRTVDVYKNMNYKAGIRAKAVSGTADIKVTASYGSLSVEVLSGTLNADSWTDFEGEFERYVSSYNNKTVAETETVTMTVEITGDCYIDEYTVIPSKELLMSNGDKKIAGSADNATGSYQVNGWVVRNTATSTPFSLSYDSTEGAVKVTGAYNAGNGAVQRFVYDPNCSYRLTAKVKAVDSTQNNKLKVYFPYDAATKTYNLTSEYQNIDITVPAGSTSITSPVFSSVVFGGNSSVCDMYIKEASLTKVETAFSAPSAAVALDKDTVLTGGTVTPSAAVTISDADDAAGLIYRYTVNDTTVRHGWAARGSEIPVYTVAENAQAGAVIRLEVIPINSQGLSGDMQYDSCTVLKKYTIGAPTGVSIENVIGGGTITAGVKVKNNDTAAAKIAVIMGYFEGEVLKGIGIDERTVSAGAEVDFAPSAQLPNTVNSSNGEIRVFVWKGSTENTDFSMKPLIDIMKVN